MLSDLALAVLRISLGAVIAAHGSQKLFGAFGGGGIEGTAAFFQSLRIRSPRVSAALVGVAEFGGGLGLALGFLTAIACAAVAASMLGAIILAHWPRFWVTEGGFEYPLVVLAALTQFGLAGPGGWSIDAAVDTESVLPEPWTFIVLAIAVAIGVGAVASARRQPAARPSGREQQTAA
jgi:putative oxidoreductase